VIHTGKVNGWESVTLSSSEVEATLLPAKGGDIYSLVDKVTGVDVLMKSPTGLLEPMTRLEDEPVEFLQNYEGGWQTLFPSAGDECVYRGRTIPFHGEVALRSWQWEPIEGAVRMQVQCETVPFELTRVVSVDTNELRVADSIRNVSDEGCDFVLGHHFVFGAPFLHPEGTLDVDATTVVTADDYWEDTARICAGQTGEWPIAPGRDGNTIDLRRVESPAVGSHDDLFVTDLRQGTASVSNPELGLTVYLDWDLEVFKWIAIWQAFGGAKTGSLAGTYALGVEPWTSRTCLTQAAATGTALRLDGGDRFETSIAVRFERH